MSEYASEPIRGLPGVLPADEHIIWQTAPDWKHLVASALHIRLTLLYFGAIVAWAVAQGDFATAVGVGSLGAFVTLMLVAFAWGVGRTTVYTLTNKRVVLRIGVALNKCINVPLTEIESANLKMLGDGHGSIVFDLKGMPRLSYVMLWPHARSLRIVRPRPMLRAIPDARRAAEDLFRATQKLQPVAPREVSTPRPADYPAMGVTA